MINRLIKISPILLLFIASSAFAGADYDDWNGSVDSDWENGANWEGGNVPTNSQVARIDDGNYSGNAEHPVIAINSTYTPRYLEVRDGGQLTINADLSTSRQGGATNGGTIIINAGGSYSTGNSYDVGIEDNGTTITVNGGTLNAGNSLIIDGDNSGTGAQPQLIVTSGTVNIGDHIEFGGDTDENPLLTFSDGAINLSGDIIHLGSDVCPIDINMTGGTFTIDGDVLMTQTTDRIDISNGTFDMHSASPADIDNSGTISMTGGTLNSSTTLDLIGTGTYSFYNVNIEASESIENTTSAINVAGDWNNDGTFTPNTSGVTFNGNADQDIDGSGTTFYDMAVSNTGGNINLLSDVTITNSLTLTQGLINSDSTNTLTINDNATTNGGDADSYVDGYMRKVGDDDFVFPIGNGGMRYRIGISNATGTNTGDVFEAEYVRGTHPNAFWDSLSYGGDPGLMYNTSILDYWKLYRTNGSAQPIITLYWEDGDSAQIDDTSDLVIAHYTGSNTWEHYGGTASGTPAAGSVSTTTRVNSFSPFTFGSTSNTFNPLPIKLLKFSVFKDGDRVLLNWTTASEINNDYFEIERSADGKTFESIKKIEGSGNSKEKIFYETYDPSPIKGQYSYYRLKQTDYDGAFTYSKVEAIFLGEEKKLELTLFPNPVTGNELFVRSPLLVSERITYRIFDMTGNLVSEETTSGLESEASVLTVQAPERKGVYILHLNSAGENLVSKFVVE